MGRHARELIRLAGRAVHQYRMIEEGDRVLVGLSGGKDSLVLLEYLDRRRAWVPIDYSLVVAHLNLGYEDPEDTRILHEYVTSRGWPTRFENLDFARVAHSEVNRENPCFLCARFRRQRLFELAREHGCAKVALGHHRDDLNATLLLNVFYAGEISTMRPALEFFGGMLSVIRPLAMVPEETIEHLARSWDLPVMASGCPSAGHSKRTEMARIIDALARDNPKVRGNIFRSLGNWRPDYLLGTGPEASGHPGSRSRQNNHRSREKEPADMSTDQRKRTRVPFQTEVTLVSGEVRLAHLASRDLSLKGLFVTTDQKLPVGTIVDISLELSGTTSKVTLDMKGQVARLTTEGLGIDFVQIDLDSFYHLRNIILYNTSDPNDIDAELATKPAFV